MHPWAQSVSNPSYMFSCQALSVENRTSLHDSNCSKRVKKFPSWLWIGNVWGALQNHQSFSKRTQREVIEMLLQILTLWWKMNHSSTNEGFKYLQNNGWKKDFYRKKFTHDERIQQLPILSPDRILWLRIKQKRTKAKETDPGCPPFSFYSSYIIILHLSRTLLFMVALSVILNSELWTSK